MGHIKLNERTVFISLIDMYIIAVGMDYWAPLYAWVLGSDLGHFLLRLSV